MNKKIAIVHTGFVSIDPLSRAFAEVCSQVDLVNIVDDSLLKEVMAANGPTAKVTQRMCWYFGAAEQLGADLIVNACSSVGEIADVVAKTVRIPVIRIDAGMAEIAVDLGARIALVATAPTTITPSRRLIERIAVEKHKEIEVITRLCANAFPLLSQGDKAGHESAVIDEIYAAAQDADVVVLAQVSMAPLLDKLVGDIDVPVLASPVPGVQQAARVIGIL
jgi:Asp/Glu/hydantoin racemase